MVGACTGEARAGTLWSGTRVDLTNTKSQESTSTAQSLSQAAAVVVSLRRGISTKKQRLDGVHVMPFGLLGESANDTSAVGEWISHSRRDASKKACNTMKLTSPT